VVEEEITNKETPINEELIPEVTEELIPEVTEELTPEVTEELTPEVTEELTPEAPEASKFCLQCNGEIFPGSVRFSARKFCSRRCNRKYFSLKRYHKIKKDDAYKAYRKIYYKKWLEKNRGKFNELMRHVSLRYQRKMKALKLEALATEITNAEAKEAEAAESKEAETKQLNNIEINN